MIAVEVARGPFDCAHCIWGRHCDETNPAPYAKWEIPGVIESRTCLLPMVSEFSALMVRLYRHYKNGLLPGPGGVLEQSAPFLRAMEIIDKAIADGDARSQIQHRGERPDPRRVPIR